MKHKFILGISAALLVAVMGTYVYSLKLNSMDGAGKAIQPTEIAKTILPSVKPKIAYIDKDFKLPDVKNELPVYDKYTLRQRQEKGLPITYGKTREYFYGDHVAYLTFDDGPNKENTEKILTILKQEKIHATFFLMGKNIEANPQVVKHIYEEGNAIGIHSYSHEYKKLYSSPKVYTDELQKTEELIYNVIGVRPIITRAPGGTAGHFTKAYWTAINDLGYIEVGWNSLTGDADGTGRTSGQELTNVQKQLAMRPYLNSHLVVLMHDAKGHEATVKALPQIIRFLKDQGYTFRVITTAIPPSW
jgi:peptidoglycan/xylan/chitin deacetylase (PgdA/CDA1 family)